MKFIDFRVTSHKFIKVTLQSVVVATLFNCRLIAQISLTTFIDAGSNAVFNTGYWSNLFMPGYENGKFKVETGISWIFTQNKENRFDGYSINGSYTLNIRKKPFTISTFYLRKSLSTELRSTNWGAVIIYKIRHFKFDLGNNYSSYRFRKKFIPSDETNKDNIRIVEPWNLMYSITYFLNYDKVWNLGITITDYDYHLIQQETNPMVNLKSTYRFNNGIEPFLMLGYKSAGLLNIKVNYFGYYFRLGMLWKITEL